MLLSVSEVVGKLRTAEGQKMFRYSMTSVVAVIVSVCFLVLFEGVIGLSAVVSATLATAISTVPSYQMNRRWAWGKSGRGHFWKEVTPFWALTFVGWGCSTISVKVAESYAKHHQFTHVARTGLVAFVYIAAFGVLWVVKFVIFNKVLFAHHPEDLAPALDGRSGLPS